MSFLRRLLQFVLAAVVLFVVVVLVAGKMLSGPRWTGPPTDHFDGQRFFNPGAPRQGGLRDFLRWQRERKPPPWQWREITAGAKPPERVGRGELRVTFINHATTLIQQDELNILTDPTWSERASPVGFAGPRRHHAPGIAFDDLPKIDVVLISHNHYDHMDMPTLRRLHERHLPRFYVGLGSGPLFVDAGFAVSELDWWGTATLSSEVTLHAVPAVHFSSRGLFDRDATLWVGFVVKGPAGVSYFAGDTAAGPHFAEIKQRLGAPRLALLPIGAYLPAWFMSPVHVSPAEAVAAHDQLGAGTSVAIHFGTFALADDEQDGPAAALDEALKSGGQRRFWRLAPGEARAVPAP